MINFFTHRYCLIIVAILSGLSQRNARAQTATLHTISLDSCYAMAMRYYPLAKQSAIIQQSRDYTLANAATARRPQLNLTGQATYQSGVTALPIELPGVTVPSLSRDQYKLYGEVLQPITELFTNKNQLTVIAANTATEEQKVAIELYKIKERINQLYFGILLADAQMVQINLLQKDIEVGLKRTQAAIDNGVALKSNATQLEAELLRNQQRLLEAQASREAYVSMLALLLNTSLPPNIELQLPPDRQQQLVSSATIRRPELRTFELQRDALVAQSQLLHDKNLPRLGVFVQGGLGRPALNMLSNGFEPYYVAGLRFNWNLSTFYTYKKEKEKEILQLNSNSINVQQEAFLLNTKISLQQQSSEIEKLNQLISTDNDLVQLREKIKITTQNQLEFGTATTNDYLMQLNAEDQAKQNRILHQLQRLVAQYNYQNIAGN